MQDINKHLISPDKSIREALSKLNELASDAILFLVDNDQKLLGSLTDGDVRRGFIKGLETSDALTAFAESNPKFIRKDQYRIEDIVALRKLNLKIVPVLNEQNQLINIVNFRHFKSYLPLDAIIMAGGRGSRLRPMTDTVPKPLLQIGGKPIIEHNMDWLRQFGIDDFWISVRYLGEQLEAYFGDGASKNVQIEYIWEDEPLGTIGAASKISNFQHDYVLVTNSDILTTLDFEDFFLDFLEKGADLAIATIPYNVDVPYAVLETKDDQIVSFREKPTYTYYSNGGIYLMKREVLERIPKNTFFDSTDLMQELIDDGRKVISYPVRQYWLDIGKPEDFAKAQADIKHLDL